MKAISRTYLAGCNGAHEEVLAAGYTSALTLAKPTNLQAVEIRLTDEFAVMISREWGVLAAKAATSSFLKNADTSLSRQLHLFARKPICHAVTTTYTDIPRPALMRSASHLLLPSHLKDQAMRMSITTHADLPVHVQPARSHQSDITSCRATRAQRVCHLAALLDVRRESMEGLGFARQSRGVALGAVLDANPGD